MADAILSGIGQPRVVGALRGVCLGGPTTYSGGTSFGRHLQIGVARNDSEGSPSPPSLQLTYPGFWRFRWSVRAGNRSLYVRAKQLVNSPPYPSVVVKANSAVGLLSDITASSTTADWFNIGPVSFTATAFGVVWVELWSNSLYSGNTVYFDHIVTT